MEIEDDLILMGIEDKFDPVLISVIRKVIPHYIAQQIVGTQPMDQDPAETIRKEYYSIVDVHNSDREHWVRHKYHRPPVPCEDWCKEVGINYRLGADDKFDDGTHKDENWQGKIHFDSSEDLTAYVLRWKADPSML